MSLLLWDESEYLICKIETIRQQMVQAAEKKSLIDETVVKLSQELDIYLVKYQKSKLSKKQKIYIKEC
ncbi:aspartyl-phosphate phosphatase Spo0E family protein [Paenibacillus alvei]|uniref:aspartyl-phosphate phosphatase Spo0E family protein n=1 Tax=Paenibacillus alvei TaxID=44250 RepID=UPI000289B054|nr:aspartyl-phosphate phosphatase Spo0E family protein [Paenibacillus alvei]EJW14578.1 Spo0E like sporulation regulatory protein [Paenibacillus alvei DSM 29]MCY9706411.1 aspartyl-phosphate phosphatase Spo0E family protein [Paenibacillus alvei]MCY9737160.1 aspartyl-phosphate phosphatase Spo0E family protein [Paenibacillus alvei]MCY9757565.1 aspartyl-phosphate phosphatase Spo0E family protein [Paenibacillus alvei]MEC0079321.1 aspartyl-phosphate phosphatase Spo0E family protein [Paenibacillus alv